MFSGVTADFLNCDWVRTIDCSEYEIDFECGTDGLNYGNRFVHILATMCTFVMEYARKL